MPKHLIYKDPRKLHLPSPGGESCLALGLDLGTSTGVAHTYFQPGEPLQSLEDAIVLSQWDLSAGDYDSGGIRVVRLRYFLTAMSPDIIFFERIRNTPTVGGFKGRPSVQMIAARITPAAQFFGALMGTVVCWAEQYGVPCVGLGIGEIKKRATRKGNASKEQVIAACNAEFGTTFDPDTYEQTGVDNIADAAFCLILGLEQYSDGVEVCTRTPQRKRRVAKTTA